MRSFLLLLAALLTLSGFILSGCGPSEADFNGAYLDPPLPVRDVALAGADGPVRLSDFRGQLVVLSFGYTSCPDVCPATLADLARTRALLEAEAARAVQVVFVSVDPGRDRPARAATYAAAFDSSFVGLSGAPADVATAATAYGVFYDRAETDSTAAGYLVDHTATTYVLDRAGRTRLLWPFGTAPDAMATDLRALL